MLVEEQDVICVTTTGQTDESHGANARYKALTTQERASVSRIVSRDFTVEVALL